MTSDHPYTETLYEQHGTGLPYIIRTFSETVDENDLIWHRDRTNRTLRILSGTDWKLQLDNSLPTSLQERIFIPRHKWHRVIKGTGVLNLKIYKNEKINL